MKNALICILAIALAITGYLLYRKGRVGEGVPIEQESVSEETETPISSEDIFATQKEEVLTESTATYDIKAVYPSFGQAKIDEGIRNFIREDIRFFKEGNNLDYVDPIGKYSYEVSYTVESSPRMTSIVFKVYEFTGGAHGNLRIRTRNYAPTGELLAIGSLFAPSSNYLSQLSEISREKLQAEYGENLGNWFEDGTTPQTTNFESFYVTANDELVIIFQPYQVAPWATGTPEITIPFNELTDILHEDYR